jgi:DUF4097 and DUF4098 domain-containing protein YvlB
MRNEQAFAWLVALLAVALAAALPAHASERTLEARAAAPGPVRVQNLLGSARIVPGEGEIVVRAVVSADKQELADAISLRTSRRGEGTDIVVEYPGSLSRVQYDGPEFSRLDTTVNYQGRRVRVSSNRGERIRVDLEISVPAGASVEFTQGLGPINATSVQAELGLNTSYGAIQVTDGKGGLAASTGSGRVDVASFRGDVNARSGSGAVSVENALGSVRARTGSGSVALRGVDGEAVAETGSGSVRVTDSTGSLRARTGSGSVRIEGLTAGPELDVSTGSGSVTASGDFAAVRNLNVRTGSGSVAVDSSSPLSMSLNLSTGSGSFRVDAPTLSNVESGRRSFRGVVGPGEGSGRIVTGSGSIRVTSP